MQMRPNKLKRKLQAGGTGYAVTGIYSTYEIDNFAPAMLGAGIDALWFDSEHGPVTPAQVGDITRACDVWGLTSMLRISGHDQHEVFRNLDLGAQTIVAPHVTTADEARNIVQGGLFPPKGHRGAYFGRQSFGVTGYFDQVEQETMLVAMIEDARGVENLDAILDVEHIDMFFVGAFDLASSLGHIKDPRNPAAVKVVMEALERISAKGRVAGIYTAPADVPRYADAGARFFMTVARNWIEVGAKAFTQAGGG